MYINFHTKKLEATGLIWNGIVNTSTGEIIARSHKPVLRPYEKRLHIRNKVNQFPCTDEDFILLAAREALKEIKTK